MSSGRKCKQCGSSEIEVDSARGDAVCTSCGSVLEDNIIVSEVTFEENAHGSSSAIGQFVSSDSKGGATGYGKFHVGTGTESREVTLRKARQGITHLCQQLYLNNHCIETAHNFFKMALMRQLTRGRRNTHIYAACVYITCRTEGTSHLLIDISDVLQICCYELGRTYLKLSQALCINIPSIDPCIYIMRFANRLEFGDKTHEVSMTAQRLVQRMKKDSIHSGRRPSGLCGAALLLAARMHDFNRLPNDIVRIVKIHESTLRKRLLEFGETPSSALTVDEFMAVDLEAEQDPPAFKAARKRDKERLQKLAESVGEFTVLQLEIDAALEKDLNKSKKRKTPGSPRNSGEEYDETAETENFIGESTISVITECLVENPSPAAMPSTSHSSQAELLAKSNIIPIIGIKPDLVAMCAVATEEPQIKKEGATEEVVFELDLEGLDDEEIDGYILTEKEAKFKDQLWNKLNAEYLQIAKAREERLAKEKEEGKPEKKKRRSVKRKNLGPSNTAGEAIEKMLQEKKISNKINYDILKTLTAPAISEESTEEAIEERELVIENEDFKEPARPGSSKKAKPNINLSFNRRSKPIMGLPVASDDEDVESKDKISTETDDIDFEPEPTPEHAEHSSLASMLNQGEKDQYFGYEEEY